jgi:hypothetical protein
MCCLAGVVQGRRGQSRILEESELEDYVQGIQRSLGTRYLIHDDATYAVTKTIATGYKMVQRSRDPANDTFSLAMNAPRTSVDWAFGLVQYYLPWVDMWL